MDGKFDLLLRSGDALSKTSYRIASRSAPAEQFWPLYFKKNLPEQRNLRFPKTMADFDAAAGKNVDPELQDFLMAEKQKAQLSAQIHEFNDICWEKCMDKPSNKLDSRTETCLNNCVNRFIDTSLFIANRFAQTLQKGQGM